MTTASHCNPEQASPSAKGWAGLGNGHHPPRPAPPQSEAMVGEGVGRLSLFFMFNKPLNRTYYVPGPENEYI